MPILDIRHADKVWDPLAGCTRKSAACRHCYAELLTSEAAKAGEEWAQGFAEAGAWTGKVDLRPERLLLPLEWEEPARILVNALSDLFHESLDNATIDKIFAVMALAPRHTFQVLTKRPKTMQPYIKDPATPARIEAAMAELSQDAPKIGAWPLPNVWLGVTAENQKEADRRIPLLLETPAALRFAAAEPLLEKIDLKSGVWLKEGGGGLDWVLAGGETGSEAQKCQPDWARAVRDQCAANGTAFFWTQWGEHVPAQESASPVGQTLDGVTHEAYPVNRS
ncbi:phage Gp37/Gp68 family protein [Beijerinckia indica]|uniref:Gp37Gp68 family protein n=1 Tax=Beijerinckia indica subsp. indica (strain ATCC 9039 / DSM 1715 / NCIMB 8712) TaxID=395963 RepID=B2IH35_BEII9|nr:phage Gp37/Gp68 family protein [Beijerinckia indica]ACB94449.1 Gp37Gp68 family protein [Beijerinckia indica subsp. indica ATCC 9039]